MPLARARKVGEDDIVLGGSLILDLPKLGWVQGGYDSFYGASAGVGFNLNKRLSLGYTMEKGLSSNFDNFGVTHEISFAYSFTPNLTEDRVFLEENNDDDLVDSDELPVVDSIASNSEMDELKKKLAENDAIIAELMFRQDSLEANRKLDLEKRFEMVMRMVRNETNGERPDLEQKAEKLFLGDNSEIAIATNNASNDGRKTPEINKYTEQSKDNLAANEPRNSTKTIVADTGDNTNTSNTNVANAITNVTTPKRIEHDVKNDAVFNKNEPSKKVKEALVTTNENLNTRPLVISDKTNNTVSDHKAKNVKIKSRKFNDLQDVEDGY
jgi:hypothetical protein